MNIFKKKMAIILTLILVANVVCSGVIIGKANASTLPKITSLSVLETSPKKGDSVTFRIGSKGSELVQYSIYMYSPTKKIWENVSGGYSKPVKQGQIHSIKINKTLNSGNNSFSVWVKRSGKPPANKGGYDDFKSIKVNVKEPSTGGSTSSKPASMKSAYMLDNEQFVGKYPSIKVSANSTVKVQYRVFLYSKASKSWVDMTSGYTSPVDPKINTSIKINAPLEKGDNSFSIWVKRANQKPSNKEGYDGFISYKVKAKEYGGGSSGGDSLPANINTVSIDKTQEKLGGTPTVTLTAKSSVKVQYAVYMYSVSKGTWEDVSGGYSSACDPKNPKAIKINKPLKPGDNVLSIWVKRADKKPSNSGGYDNFEKRTIKIGTSPSKVVKISSIICEEGDAIVGHRPNINVRGTSGNNEDLKY
ncbi:hypothetical protein, partial [Clostridium sp.]|uniref:hypothetical protein n=1 Tax=Clostridium sp. TaxID=1506 RepID=UPI002FC5F2EF